MQVLIVYSFTIYILMVLSKQLGVFLNFVHNRFKQNVNEAFVNGGFDITAEQFLLLDTLWTEGTLTQQQIADIMLKDKNSVVKLIDSLEDKKLVKRENSSKDRRQNLIKITAKANKIKDKVTDMAIIAVDSIMEGVDSDELKTFINVLDRMARNMDKKIDLLEIARKFPTTIKQII